MPDFYLMNEVQPGGDPLRPEDISVFGSAEEVEKYLEPWYVDETYLLLGQDGKRRILKAEKGRFRVARAADQTDYSEKLKEFLGSYLSLVERVVHKKRGITDVDATDFGRLPTETLFRLALLFD